MNRRLIRRIVMTVRTRCGEVRTDTDGGFVSLYVVVITLGLLAMTGLVIDGGNALAAREQAADAAQQASRAGADALSPASLRGNPSGLTATPAAAQAAANSVLTSVGVSGSVRIDGDTVTVTVVVHRKTTILSAVGVTDISATATETAIAVHGTTTGES